MQTGTSQENRGGKRKGAGRKPGPKTTLSAHQVAVMRRLARKWARGHGKTIDEVLLEMIYDEKGRAADVLAAIKVWKEYTAPKPSEGGTADKENGPMVYLPEHRPKLVAVDKKTA